MIGELPPQFVQNIRSTFEDGDKWLEQLPDLLNDVCADWNLTLGPPFLLSYNYVAPATRADGSEAVLKVGFPHPELFAEIASTNLYGDSMVRLLDADTERRAMLLERLRPGTMLMTYFDPSDPNGGRDDEATEIIGQIMRRLWRPALAEAPLLTLDDWMSDLEPTDVRYPANMENMRDEALARYREMHDPNTPMLLHGDLHHYNILRDDTSPEGWRAIDPKGIVGDALFEVYALLANPNANLMEHADLKRRVARRVAVLADVLEVERETVRVWGFVGQTLSSWWNVDPKLPDGGASWENDSRIAQLLREM